MLFLLQIICCIVCIICALSAVDQGMQKWDKDNRVKRKKDLSEQEFHFIMKILSIGLVDADPDILHHLKEYRDVYRFAT